MDPEAADSEWGGGLRSDLAAFLDDATIDAAIDYARPLELPPRPGTHRYVAFADPSGDRHDAFTLCIAHSEGERHTADVVRGTYPPFDPHAVVSEYAALLRDYGISTVTGDNYSAAWSETAFKDAGITYQRSELAKSALYLEALPAFMRGAVSIPDHPKLIRELRLLERRVSRIGKDTVDHGRNGSDDHANALVGALRGLATHTLKIPCSAGLTTSKAKRRTNVSAATSSQNQRLAEGDCHHVLHRDHPRRRRHSCRP